MAVEYVRLRRSRKRGNSLTSRTGTKVYLVKMDPPDPDGALIAADPLTALTPAPLGQSWSESEPFLICTDQQALEVENSAGHYEVTCEFTIPTRDPSSGGTGADDPLARKAEVQFSHQVHVEPWSAAGEAPSAENADGQTVSITWRWGNAVVNSAGQTFDPTLDDDYFDPIITIQRNVASHNWQAAQAYIGAVNDDPVTIPYRGRLWIFQPEQLRVMRYDAASVYENGVTYDRETIEIAARSDKWRRKVLDQGLMAYVGEAGQYEMGPIRDTNGDPVTATVPLNGSGQVLSGTNPVFLVWKRPKRTALQGLIASIDMP